MSTRVRRIYNRFLLIQIEYIALSHSEIYTHTTCVMDIFLLSYLPGLGVNSKLGDQGTVGSLIADSSSTSCALITSVADIELAFFSCFYFSDTLCAFNKEKR